MAKFGSPSDKQLYLGNFGKWLETAGVEFKDGKEIIVPFECTIDLNQLKLAISSLIVECGGTLEE